MTQLCSQDKKPFRLNDFQSNPHIPNLHVKANTAARLVIGDGASTSLVSHEAQGCGRVRSSRSVKSHVVGFSSPSPSAIRRSGGLVGGRGGAGRSIIARSERNLCV